MICSMTAFARAQNQSEYGSLVCEMRSINHRYLETSVHVPDMFNAMEMPIREAIRKLVKRGKLECNIRFQPSPQKEGSLFSINTGLVRELSLASAQIAEIFEKSSSFNPTDILRFPGVLEAQTVELEAMKKEILALVNKTTKELVTAREREGEELKQLFLQRLDSMQEQLAKIRERLPLAAQEQQERILKRFNEAKLELDPTRLEQEMLMFVQKIDISEEIDRTETHISEIRRILQQGGAVGRRLDFLLQELNREANTIASKSVDSIITHAAVEMKVLIEQIREQVQNVE